MVSGTRKNRKSFSLRELCLAHLTQRRCYLLMLNFSVMLNTEKNTVSPVQTKNEQKSTICIVGRILKNKSIQNKANAKIKAHYLKQEKEVIIDDLIDDFQEKFNYENFISELGLSEMFNSWKTFNLIRQEAQNG